MDEFIPPEGESFKQLQKRVMPVFETITQNTTGNTLIITHVGVNRVILSTLFDFPLNELFKINQPYGCINEFSWNIASRTWQWERRKYEKFS